MGTHDPADLRQSADEPRPKMHGEVTLSRGIILATGALMLSALVFGFIAKRTDIGATRLTPAAAVETLDLKFQTAADGVMTIINTANNAIIHTLDAKRDGYIKIVMRNLTMERQKKSLDETPHVKLSKLVDDQVTVTDVDTGRIILVSAFGPPNRIVFTDLFDKARAAQTAQSATGAIDTGGVAQ